MSAEQTFGGWLRRRRNELGLTRDQLADNLGFSLAMLRKLESGERRPSGQIASLLAHHFRIPTDEHAAFVAFARTGDSPVASVETDGILPPAPWRSLYARQTNLPTMLSPLVGREREAATARDALLQPKTRLLTLTGTAGIGKTRLGLQIALSLVDHFEDGIFFVDLAPITDPDLVMLTIARVLGLKESGRHTIDSVLLDHVRERRMLLMLDNFEQVLDAAIGIVQLLEASPWLKVLITSREALHIRGERRFPVPPLGLPDMQGLPSMQSLQGYPSVELFVERARAVSPEFALTEENAADVAAICVGLDGLPLAIELAAARTRHLSPLEMRSALGSRLQLLTGGARDLPARHRTLRAAIEWSYNLLDSDEQRLFRLMGVFVGGFTSDALAAIVESQPGVPMQLPDALHSLADKNLVQEQRGVSSTDDGRFRLLEAVREFALERMVSESEVDSAREKHAAYYLSLADSADEQFNRPQGSRWGYEAIKWVDRLEADLDNMRAALDWYRVQAEIEAESSGDRVEAARTTANLEMGLRLTTGLRRIWFVRGHFTEGLQWLRAFLVMVPQPLPTSLQPLRAAYAAALALLGRLTLLQGDAEPVRPLLEESLAIARDIGDKQRIAFILLNVGAVGLAQGDYTSARTYHGECLDLYRELGNNWGAAAALEDLGSIELNEGNPQLARALLEESLQLYRAVGESFGAASVLGSLGSAAYYRQDYDTAHSLWEESLQVRREIRDRSRECHSLVLLGWVELRRANYTESGAMFREGLVLGRKLGAVVTLHWGLAGFGALASAEGNAERAALLFGAADALREARHVPLPPANQAELDSEIALARERLPADVWSKTQETGHIMALEDAIAVALDAASPKPRIARPATSG
ncbi:MAG: tetratricopeptide repeat protein [Chloroflexota bacterium]